MGKQKRKVLIIVEMGFAVPISITGVGSYKDWEAEMKKRKMKLTFLAMRDKQREMNTGKIVSIDTDGAAKIFCKRIDI